MNVAFDKWIPVVTTAGGLELASLCDVMTEGPRFADLAVRPHERVSLLRLFLCVAHAAINGPEDIDAWREVPKRLPEAARTYLEKWKEYFELLHPKKPWLQVARLKKNGKGPDDDADWTPVSKLVFSFASGHASTLFDHEGLDNEKRKIPIQQTLLSMLAFQCFSPGGLISQVYWGTKLTTKSSKDAPCIPASMIHSILRGPNLGETIHLNMPTFEDLRFTHGERKTGRPVWEMMPALATDSGPVENATQTYVGRLVPMARLIRLHPSGERMLIGDGLAYPVFTDGFPAEPTAAVIVRRNREKEERAILSYRPAKALWRELSSVIVKRTAEGSGGPLSLRAIRDGEECDLIVAALARDQASIVDNVESVFHIPSRLRSPEGTAAYEGEVKGAEAIASRLGWAVEIYRGEVDHGWEGRLKSAGPAKGALKAKLQSFATIHYWTTVEKNLSLLMGHIDAIGTDAALPTREAWRKMLFSTACDAYRLACGQETPRQLRAFAKGWQKLTTAREEPKSETDESKEENA